MNKKETPITHLQQFLPSGTYEAVYHYLNFHHVHLTIARERKSILGDYRHKLHNKNHRISVNGNLNKFSFLITLLHELAHLLTFEKYGDKVSAHGREWKYIFGQLLAQFIEHKIFPKDINDALLSSIQNPAASSCADEHLLRILKNYDEKESDLVFVETIPEGSLFKTYDGKVFKKGERIRKRFRCIEVRTKKVYLFSPVYEAEVVNTSHV